MDKYKKTPKSTLKHHGNKPNQSAKVNEALLAVQVFVCEDD